MEGENIAAFEEARVEIRVHRVFTRLRKTVERKHALVSSSILGASVHHHRLKIQRYAIQFLLS